MKTINIEPQMQSRTMEIVLSLAVVLTSIITCYIYWITERNNRRRFLADLAIKKARDCNNVYLGLLESFKANVELSKTNQTEDRLLGFWVPIVTELVVTTALLSETNELFKSRVFRRKAETRIIYRIFWQELATGIRQQLEIQNTNAIRNEITNPIFKQQLVDLERVFWKEQNLYQKKDI